jgi:hypothetical protein
MQRVLPDVVAGSGNVSVLDLRHCIEVLLLIPRAEFGTLGEDGSSK